jgi:hypothetical protein
MNTPSKPNRDRPYETMRERFDRLREEAVKNYEIAQQVSKEAKLKKPPRRER